MTRTGFPMDEGLLARFRDAGRAIAWRPAPSRPRTPKGHRAQIAHLHDEEARVESWGSGEDGGVEVDSGPVGALVLLLEADRRGVPTRLETREAGDRPTFPQGALVAVWGGRAGRAEGLAAKDLVDLARYALV